LNEELEKAYAQLDKQLKARKQKTMGKIVDVKVGPLSSFIPLEKIRNPNRADKEAIQIEVASPDGYIVRKVMVLSTHPNSAIMHFYGTYGDWPKKGMEIALRYDESSGFWRVAL
jgi:hypothetical protein